MVVEWVGYKHTQPISIGFHACMSNFKIIESQKSYTFSEYFKFPNPPAEIVAEFGYSYERKKLDLPKFEHEITYIDFLQTYLERNIRIFAPAAEISVRECLIMPILAEICHQTECQVYSEYPLNVGEKLKGTLDYYLYNTSNLLVIEAKQSDLKRGFTQLAVEMIALDQSITGETNIVYGAVTNGDDWKFGTLERRSKHISEDINLYRVPEGLEKLVRVLVGILT